MVKWLRTLLCSNAAVEVVPGTAFEYCRTWTNFRSYAGSIMGTGCIPVDYIRYDFGRWCA